LKQRIWNLETDGQGNDLLYRRLPMPGGREIADRRALPGNWQNRKRYIAPSIPLDATSSEGGA
jgi:hypothetical protein